MNSADWPHPQQIWEKGNCRGADDPDIFYPDRDAATYATVVAQAKQYCHGPSFDTVCPVIMECLLYGLLKEDGFGIWGGLSPRERNAVRRSGTIARYKQAVMFNDSPYYPLIEEYLRNNGKNTNPPQSVGDEEDL